jgi:hypothetical protein
LKNLEVFRLPVRMPGAGILGVFKKIQEVFTSILP